MSRYRNRVNLWSSADTENLGTAGGANSLGGGLAVLHGDTLGLADLFFGPALYTIGFHRTPHNL